MLYEYENDNNYALAFGQSISGAGWANDLEKIIKEEIAPDSFERRNIKIGWDSGEVYFLVTKDSVNFKMEIDEADTISLILLSVSTEENKQKLKDWYNIILNKISK